MQMECAEEKHEPCILHCGISLTIDSIFEQKDILEQILNKKTKVILKASEIIEVDTAGLQLFFNFLNEMDKLNLSYTWDAPSNVIIQSAALLGMKELLKLP